MLQGLNEIIQKRCLTQCWGYSNCLIKESNSSNNCCCRTVLFQMEHSRIYLPCPFGFLQHRYCNTEGVQQEALLPLLPSLLPAEVQKWEAVFPGAMSDECPSSSLWALSCCNKQSPCLPHKCLGFFPGSGPLSLDTTAGGTLLANKLKPPDLHPQASSQPVPISCLPAATSFPTVTRHVPGCCLFGRWVLCPVSSASTLWCLSPIPPLWSWLRLNL